MFPLILSPETLSRAAKKLLKSSSVLHKFGGAFSVRLAPPPSTKNKDKTRPRAVLVVSTETYLLVLEFLLLMRHTTRGCL
ncbi:hypothetical protein CEXT_374761 [Caerostris extrusa]|uniref:Uncharacterized protein n=1 Tax=Caerostris extrusa TaxID=172846 RepID=A0AAV4NCB9_CAEEX|nr:hypothetical protein CEXT_374761 [Caerostris extrusa]